MRGERGDAPKREHNGERREFQPRGERRDHHGVEARGEFKPKSHGMKGERTEGGPRKSFGYKGKPSGNFGGGKKFGGGRPGGFGKPSGSNFKRPNRAEV